MTNADVHKIANELSDMIKKSIEKGNTFIWESYVHNFEQFDRDEVVRLPSSTSLWNYCF